MSKRVSNKKGKHQGDVGETIAEEGETMKIKDTCKCGAKFTVGYAKWQVDAQNRHEKWLAAHQVCREEWKQKERIVRNNLAADNERLLGIVKMGTEVVEDFLPNVGKCALQDYARLNEFLIESKAALEKSDGHT